MKSLEEVKSKISDAACLVNRDPQSIQLIAVSKKQPKSKIINLINKDHLDFGENQLQEITGKWNDILDLRQKIKLHFIGSIQSKKTDEILKLSDVIHSIDREKIVQQIHKSQHKDKKAFFAQVNIGREDQKSGIDPNQIDDFLKMCKSKYNLDISGLMCIPPNNIDPEPYYLEMKKIASRNKLHNLSMGMSNDFEKAIHCGATHIRLGTVLFGERASKQ